MNKKMIEGTGLKFHRYQFSGDAGNASSKAAQNTSDGPLPTQTEGPQSMALIHLVNSFHPYTEVPDTIRKGFEGKET